GFPVPLRSWLAMSEEVRREASERDTERTRRQLHDMFGYDDEAIAQIRPVTRRGALRRPGGKDAELPGEQPLVAAIVTARQLVLLGRRNDGVPPWTFIVGEIEPGERPVDAAVREVKEETGLEVRAGKIIGQRVHPRTGRTIIYMEARPV